MEGKTLTSISKKVQKHVSTIELFVDRLKDNGKFNKKKGSGRIQLFKTDIRKILRKRKKDGKRQLKDIYEEAKTAKIPKISENSIKKILQIAGIQFHKAAKKPLLTKSHKLKRYELIKKLLCYSKMALSAENVHIL